MNIMKKYKYYYLFILIFLFFQLFYFNISSYTPHDYIQPKSLPILEIDSQSVRIAEEIGGGVYYHEVDAIVPFFPKFVREEWKYYKDKIAKRIGQITPSPSKESALWRNSATSVQMLLKDATMSAPFFWEMCVSIAHQSESTANFGIDNLYMIKSKKSMLRKIQGSMKLGISEKEAVTKLRDALRGTIIAETPEKVFEIVQNIKEFASKKGHEVVFINIWEENRPSGYVGIHAKMLFPVYDSEGLPTDRNIITEIQIHLRCIMDGTKECVKEREHLLYEQMHRRGIEPEIQAAASTLLYLTALKQCSSW